MANGPCLALSPDHRSTRTDSPMTAAGAGDWARVKNVFQAAPERSPLSRSTFLNETCGQDTALRAEVESLLAAHEAAGTSFERPAVDALIDRPFQRGDRLGPYE